MKKWHKRLIVLIVIWLTGGIAVTAAVSTLFCNIIFEGMYADMGRYVDVAQRLVHYDDYEPGDNELKAAICLRGALHDEVIDSSGCSYLASYVYVDENGFNPFSFGEWCVAARKAESEDEVNFIRNSFALMNYKNAVSDGYGEEIYKQLSGNADTQIRVDRYCLDGVILYPLEISFLNASGQVLKTIECKSANEYGTLTEIADDEVYIQTLNLEDMYNTIKRGKTSARIEAESVGQTLDCTKHGNTSEKMVRPWKAKITNIYVNDGHAMICVQQMNLPQALLIGLVGFAVWTVIMVIIGLVVYFSDRDKKKTDSIVTDK